MTRYHFIKTHIYCDFEPTSVLGDPRSPEVCLFPNYPCGLWTILDCWPIVVFCQQTSTTVSAHLNWSSTRRTTNTIAGHDSRNTANFAVASSLLCRHIFAMLWKCCWCGALLTTLIIRHRRMGLRVGVAVQVWVGGVPFAIWYNHVPPELGIDRWVIVSFSVWQSWFCCVLVLQIY